jgi:hypothetical protein
MEASYLAIRIIQTYPNIRLAAGVPNEPIRTAKKTYIIGVYPLEGVHVEVD